MHLDFSNENELEGVLTLSIDQNDFLDKVEKSLKSYQKSMRHPGFRAGKTPLGLLKKQIGTDVKKEEILKLIQSEITNYHKEKGNEIIFLPIMDENDIDWAGANDYKFTFKVGLRPKLEINLDSLSKVNSPIPVISENDINEESKRLRKQYGDIERLDEVIWSDDLVVVFRVAELIENEEGQQEGFTKMVRLEGKNMNQAQKDLLTGKKPEEQFVVELKKLIDESTLVEMLEIDSNKLNELGESFEITIQGSITLKEAEISEEFFKKVFYDDSVKTEEDFNSRIKEDLTNFFENKSVPKLIADTKKELLSSVDVNVSESFIREWFMRNAELDKVDDVEKSIAEFIETTKWDLITEELAKQYEITVEESEVRDNIRSYVIQQYAYQLQNIGMEQIEQMTDNLYKRENFRIELRQNLLEDKLVKGFKEKGVFTQIEMSKTEFEQFVKTNEL